MVEVGYIENAIVIGIGENGEIIMFPVKDFMFFPPVIETEIKGDHIYVKAKMEISYKVQGNRDDH